jgi:hypothetical protein
MRRRLHRGNLLHPTENNAIILTLEREGADSAKLTIALQEIDSLTVTCGILHVRSSANVNLLPCRPTP